MAVAVFHHITEEPREDKMGHTIEQILNFDGQITFDGAYESLWEHRVKLGNRNPILFVQGMTLGTKGVMDWNQIADLATIGWTIGWHGWSHRRLTELEGLDLEYELCPPFKMYFYAYPHGDWDERVIEKIDEMGFIKAFSTTQGEEGNDFAIPRHYV